MRSLPVFSLILVTLLAACTSKPLRKETGLSPTEFWEDQANRKQYFQSLDGKAKVRLEERGRKVSGNGRVLMPSKEAIKMELRDMFGRLHFSALKQEKKFVAYFPGQKLAYQDNEGGRQYLIQNLRIDLSFDQIMELWVGKLPSKLGSTSFQSWKWDGKSGNYVGHIESKDVSVDCYVDGDLGILRKLVWNRPWPAFQVEYEDLGSCCSGKTNDEKLDFAYSIKLEVERTGEKVELEWEDLLTGAKLPPGYDIELPKDTDKILLKP